MGRLYRIAPAGKNPRPLAPLKALKKDDAKGLAAALARGHQHALLPNPSSLFARFLPMNLNGAAALTVHMISGSILAVSHDLRNIRQLKD